MEPNVGIGCLLVITAMSLAVAFTRTSVIGEKIEHAKKDAEVRWRAVEERWGLVAAYHELGYATLKLKKYEASIAASSQAIKLMPSNAQTQNNLGEAYAALDRWDDARKAFERARSQNPTFAIAYVNLAGACRHLGDFQSAIVAGRESIRLLPRSGPAHYETGLSYIAAGNVEAAFDEYLILTSLNRELASRPFDEINKSSMRDRDRSAEVG